MANLSRGGLVAGAMVLVVAAVCVRLGLWQLDRLEQRRARNAALQEALALPPLVLKGGTLAAVARDPERFRYRRVRLEGEYDTNRDIVLRGRAYQGRPGVHLVSPLRVAGDTAVLVNRGWVPAPDAATIDPEAYGEPGRQVVEGLLMSIPAGEPDAGAVRPGGGGARALSYRRLVLDSLRAELPYELPAAYVQQLPGAERAAPPLRLPLPELDEGPHLGYAVQWFSFAAIAVVGFLLVALRRGESR